MAESIPGGATLAADGKTWQNAKGEPLTATQVQRIEQLHAERSNRRARAEAERLAAEAQGNPIASALMALLGGRQTSPVSRAAVAADISPDVLSALAAAGYDTPEAIAAATDDELLAVEGVGTATLKKLRRG